MQNSAICMTLPLLFSGCRALPARARRQVLSRRSRWACRPRAAVRFSATGHVLALDPAIQPHTTQTINNNNNKNNFFLKSARKRLVRQRFLCLVSSFRSLLSRSAASPRPDPARRGRTSVPPARELCAAASLSRQAGGRAKWALHLVRAAPPRLTFALGRRCVA